MSLETKRLQEALEIAQRVVTAGFRPLSFYIECIDRKRKILKFMQSQKPKDGGTKSYIDQQIEEIEAELKELLTRDVLFITDVISK